MKQFTLYLFSILLILNYGCVSSTPGDAASKGGHQNQAANLYMQGAQQGDGEAALKLGLLLDNGSVSKSTYGEANVWFEKACELGELAGCHNLGVAYEYGKNGCSKNMDQAKNYYSIAANSGYMQSQYNLGSLYSNQYISDNLEGYKWMLIAEKSAKECSSKPLCQWVLDDPPGHRTNLRNRLSKEQIDSAKSYVESWKPSN